MIDAYPARLVVSAGLPADSIPDEEAGLVLATHCDARPRLNQHNFAAVKSSLSYYETVPARQSDIAERIDEAAGLIESAKTKPTPIDSDGIEIDDIRYEHNPLQLHDICHMAIFTMSPKWRFDSITAEAQSRSA